MPRQPPATSEACLRKREAPLATTRGHNGVGGAKLAAKANSKKVRQSIAMNLIKKMAGKEPATFTDTQDERLQISLRGEF